MSTFAPLREVIAERRRGELLYGADGRIACLRFGYRAARREDKQGNWSADSRGAESAGGVGAANERRLPA
jgi:hypothetical protein